MSTFQVNDEVSAQVTGIITKIEKDPFTNCIIYTVKDKEGSSVYASQNKLTHHKAVDHV